MIHPEDYQDSLRTDRHDTPRCESCGRPADSDGLDDGLCTGCAEGVASWTTEYGVLLSHAHEHHVIGGFRSVGLARAHAQQIIAAQPGIDYALMYRDRGGPWRSVINGADPAEVARERWAS